MSDEPQLVYCLHQADYDAQDIVGVFSTLDAAKERLPGREWEFRYGSWSTVGWGDPYISVFVLDEQADE